MPENGAVIDKTARRLVPWPAKEGVFNALEARKADNDEGATLGDLTTFTYMGYAVDGTAANVGTTPNTLGDNNLDGFVKGTFLLQPGAYSFFVGGANYAGQAPTAECRHLWNSDNRLRRRSRS